MIFLNMPIVIVGAFLFLTLVVGIYFSRKKTTFREYAVGNKQFSTSTLVATVLATAFGGGGLIRTVECVYDLGLYWVFFILLGVVDFWIMSKLVLRMGPFMQHLSMAETIGSIYGKYPRIMAALIGICNSICTITMQIIVISSSISICLTSIDPNVITIFSTLLLIFYSMFGGVRAVTYTDVLQFLTFSIIIPLLAWFMFVNIYNPVSEIVTILQSHTKFHFSKLFCFNTRLMDMLLLILSCMVPYIGPGIIQRVYMSSGPMQAQKVFAYTTFFSFIIRSFIILIGVFVFVSTSDLAKESVWGHIITHISPIFKAFLSISLLAMAMSTADSYLNACSIMVSHDIVKGIVSNEKEIPDLCKIKVARLTTLVVGLLAMLIALKSRDLLQLMLWSLYSIVPILSAPFILAIFGFRGTSCTAFIGMTTGILSILTWNKWVKSTTDIDGAFIAMLANGLAMMTAHYLLKQPDGTGWVKPDNTFKQIQQENFRKKEERKEAIRRGWENKKMAMAKLKPSHTTMVCVGLYTTITTLLTYFMERIMDHNLWLVFQLLVSSCFIGYPFLYDLLKKIKDIPNWSIGLSWVVWLTFFLPTNILWYWWKIRNPILTTSLCLTHFSVILWVLPLYIGISIVTVTSLVSMYFIYIQLPYPVLCSLLPLFLAGIFLFILIICFKIKVCNLTTQNIYLKDQIDNISLKQFKSSLYEAALVPFNHTISPKKYGSILNQVVRKVEESISFLDNHTALYKEDIQSIINKLYDWVAYFNKREKSKDHALLQPDTITLDKLIRKVEVALSQEMSDPPKLLVEKIRSPNKEPCSEIVCDVNQLTYSLVKAILRIGKSEGPNVPIISIELHPTSLQFKQADSIEHSFPVLMDFQAVALIISQSTTSNEYLPKVKSCYNEIDFVDPKVEKDKSPSIDIHQETISSMVRAHYGYLEASFDKKVPTMLMVLPNDVTDIMNKMTAGFPIDALTVESPVTPKEEADSMMELMNFHDYVSKLSCEVDPIDIKTVAGILLLLRKHFRFKRHASGQLFYVHAVGIAKLVTDWVFHSPKVVYAALLYGLVRRTCLPLSYIKEHYNLGVYAFVSNVVGIDKRENLDHPSLLYVQNRLEKAIKEEHVQLSVLFIKLAERLYDLRHAAGYIHLSEVKHMAQETLTIDVQIAHTYLGSEIAQELEKAAKQALEVCKIKKKEDNK
ncbi:sodium:solute symporter family transporter [Candidatus Cardinium hertigii]|uniref:sodium:solute symporter family transporter n=1 Tax=Candidatus Cardinium hertigii TaxID=247481 RepID=UPI003D7C9294